MFKQQGRADGIHCKHIGHVLSVQLLEEFFRLQLSFTLVMEDARCRDDQVEILRSNISGGTLNTVLICQIETASPSLLNRHV